MKALALVMAATAVGLMTPVVHAADKRVSVGVQTLLGGSLYSTPDNPPPNYDGLGFVGEAGGFSWGVGGYGEFRPIPYLGLSLGMGYDRIRLQRDVTLNNVIETTESVTASNFRLGFLVKGILPGPFGRAWLGLGPEFLVPLSADAELDVEGAGQSDALSARTGGSTLLSFALGLVFDAGPIEIPVDLRASRVLNQESDWADRVSADLLAGTYEVTARSDWDFRLGLGVGAAF